MQNRHTHRQIYFNDSAATSREYYMKYINSIVPFATIGINVLEIGCGEGGNLLPFAEEGCKVTGIDLSATRIKQANEFFLSSGREGTFTNADFFDMEIPDGRDRYDVIIIHDVIEHIREKEAFVRHVGHFMKETGIVFWGFPAWQMPFGGHQQICRSKVCAALPFTHLLPAPAYKAFLKLFGEEQACVNELMDIKRCKVPIELFEKLMRNNGYTIADRRLWFINPHYEQKFNLKPRLLYDFLSRVKYIRNFFTTACFYITKKGDGQVNT